MLRSVPEHEGLCTKITPPSGAGRTDGVLPEDLARLAGGGRVDEPRQLALRERRVRDARDARRLRHVAAGQQRAAQQRVHERGLACRTRELQVGCFVEHGRS